MDKVMCMVAGKGEAAGSNFSKLVRKYFDKQPAYKKYTWAGKHGIPLGSCFSVAFDRRAACQKMGVPRNHRKMFHTNKLGKNKTVVDGKDYLMVTKTTTRADFMQLMFPHHVNCETRHSVNIQYIPPNMNFEGLSAISLNMDEVRHDMRHAEAVAAGKAAQLYADAQREAGLSMPGASEKGKKKATTDFTKLPAMPGIGASEAEKREHKLHMASVSDRTFKKYRTSIIEIAREAHYQDNLGQEMVVIITGLFLLLCVVLVCAWVSIQYIDTTIHTYTQTQIPTALHCRLTRLPT